MKHLTISTRALSRRLRRRSTPRLILFATGAVLVLFLCVFAVFAWYARDLPEPGKIQRKSGFSTTFYDRNDKVIYELYEDQNRVPVSLNAVSEYLRKGTIAIEDKNFYSHSGISSRGIIRAFISSVLKGRVEGGSTLTQQLIKNVLLTSERSVTRKIKEAILASEIERRYTKDEILEMYLNEAPYGGTIWGAEAAAKAYFGKSARQLNLAESAFLAGLPQRPSYYSPFLNDDKAYEGRTENVLRRMREDKYITKEQEKDALSQVKKMKFESPKVAFNAPHFVFYLIDELSKIIGKEKVYSGIKVKTTIDLDIQKKAEEVVHSEINKIKSLNATNGSAVVIDSQSGEILAMVGSYDYNDEKYGKYNTALALRQPGSAMKFITYGAAFEKGYTPSTVIMDVQTTFPNQGEKDYAPVNYDGQYRGPMQLRFALGNSTNVVAVKLLAMIGIRDFLKLASDFGMSQYSPTEANIKRFGLSATLGGGETRLVDLTNAYAALARGGIYKPFTAFTEVKDYNNKTIYKQRKPDEKRVISEGTAFLLSHILSDNNARLAVFGTRSYLNIPGKTVAVKTGTTNDKRDNYIVGYTNDITVGVWVGNNDNSPMNPKISSGATGASPIWHQLMIDYLKKYDDGIIKQPDSVTALEVDAYLGGLPKDGQSKRSEYFIKGTEPKEVSPYYKKVKLSRSTGKLANDVEIRMGDYDEKDFIVITENDPISTDGKNRWQEAINAWMQSQPDEKYKSPTETSIAKTDDIVVQIKDPNDKQRVNSNTFMLKARITSLDPVTKIEIFTNGSTVKTITEDREEIEEGLNLSDGIYELRVRAENSKGKAGDSIVKIGINQDWQEPTKSP